MTYHYFLLFSFPTVVLFSYFRLVLRHHKFDVTKPDLSSSVVENNEKFIDFICSTHMGRLKLTVETLFLGHFAGCIARLVAP